MDENQLEQYLFQETEELMSYSSSFEARSRDRFVVFINELFELGSHKEYNTMFHSDRVVLENKSRRLMDYLEVEAFIDRIEIVSLNEEVTRFTTKLIKEEKGFDNISFDEVKSKITVLLPPLSVNALLELKGAVNGKVDSYSKSVGMLRSQSAQQVKAGIDNEYIFPPDAAKVAKEIDLKRQVGGSFIIRMLLKARAARIHRGRDLRDRGAQVCASHKAVLARGRAALCNARCADRRS